MTVEDTLNKLAKWRNVFAGWQLGTRLKGDPESDAVRDHREVTLLLRAEVNAFTKILLNKGVCTQEEWTEQVRKEAEYLDRELELRFPGISTSLDGVNLDMPEALETMKNWKP